jgi:hypothetical protein
MLNRKVTVIVAVMLVLLLAGLIAYAVAQQPGAGFQGGGAQPPQGARGMGMRGFGMGTPAIAVANGAVFVVSGNMLYKFDAESLELLGQAELPRPQWQQGQPGQ